MAGVDAEADMRFDGLVELRMSGRENGFETLFGIVKLLLIERFQTFVILLTVLHVRYLS